MLWFVLWLVGLAGSFLEAHRVKRFARAADYWKSRALTAEARTGWTPPATSSAKRR